MRISCPVVAVIGRKASGKTTIIETLIPELIKEGFSIASIKHIAHEDFSFDKEGSDTWRHWRAGANPVLALSKNEVNIIIRGLNIPLDKIFEAALLFGAKIIVLEGFSSMVLGERGIGKIICVRNIEEYEEYKKHVGNDLIAFCSLKKINEQILDIKEDHKIIIERTLNFIRRRLKILEILRSLAKLNCGRCGRKTCESLAEEIYSGSASIDDCIAMRMRTQVSVRLTISGEDIPLQPFVSEIIRRAVLGMVSSLKNVSIHGDEKVDIRIEEKW